MPLRLQRLTEVANRPAALTALEDIFFRSALRRRFASAAERAAFLATWTGWYVTHAPADVWFALTDEDSVIGYLTGCRDSAGTAELFTTIPGYALFADRFAAFPAHLHINVHPDHRDRGVGARLIGAFAQDCAATGLAGIHLVTGADARNAVFYRRNGFTVEDRRGALLFLGRPLQGGGAATDSSPVTSACSSSRSASPSSARSTVAS
ncbi:GNAT family N-acetyltransferase [Azospirillum halopraeferens]|uniref:GNAT family N-acetyltransferase n=1 Tax=Azospirillum halopraeferens TaxID=34010 RepID=UPI001FDF50A2|nr:GNAT family N-acetyltransferase [Azospirillum halopraeferens]